MYVTVQFLILEILLGLIFLVVLYFMMRELLKKIIRREIREIKEPLQVLANYLVQQSQQEEDDPQGPEGPGNAPADNRPLPASSPEKLPEEPVDIADEFVQLKNTNRISAYNIRVQKIWDLYKQNKITLHQYKDELLRLKKQFGIATSEDEALSEEKLAATQTAADADSVKVDPLTPTPSASPKEKIKKIDTEAQPALPNRKSSGKKDNDQTQETKGNKNNVDIKKDKDNKAASL